VLPAVDEIGLEQALYISAGHIGIGDSCVINFDFDQWFEPGRTPGAVANQLNFAAVFLRDLRDRQSDFIGAYGNGSGFSRHVDLCSDFRSGH